MEESRANGEQPIYSEQVGLERIRLSLLWGLLPLYLVLLGLRWKQALQSNKIEIDHATPVWLERCSGVDPLWFVLPAIPALVGVYWAWCLRWPTPQVEAVPLDRAVLSYLLVQLGALVWMSLWLRQGLLSTQFAYSFWMLAWLWPWHRRLEWKSNTGNWCKWAWAGYVMAFLGALLYAILFHPTPSSNQIVPVLLKSSAGERALWALQICVLTPLLEESWYRSILSRPTPGRFVFSAVLFGLVHADPSGLPQLIWLGLVFAWVRWGGGLRASVLTHALWNFTVLVYILGA